MIYSSGFYESVRYDSLEAVIATATEWLETEQIGMVVGYGRQSQFSDLTMPTFVKKPEMLEGELVWNRFCDYNLLNYTNLAPRQVAQGKGGIAIILKPCELHNLDILCEEGNMSGTTRDNVRPMVMACSGIYETEGLNAYTESDAKPNIQTKCLDCPEYVKAHGQEQVDKERSSRADYQDYKKEISGEKEIQWGQTLEKCLHCYACRNVCPSCYCTDGCPADEAATAHVTNALKVIKGIDASRQVVYNLVRTWHIQARCSECQECERVCPVHIPIMALKAKLGREFEGEGSPGDVIGFLTSFTQKVLDDAKPSAESEPVEPS
ncbi:MAG: 4Fe-4S dicluster domain-containing protein [Leptospirillia bacterium]